MGYSEILFENIRNKISDNHPNSDSKKKPHIQKLICPACGKEEAWAYYEKPLAIICPRANECGVTTPIKEIYPDCFQNLTKDFPPTKKDPNATARAYLVSRGLNPSKIEFKQGKIKRDGKEYQSVRFQIDSSTFSERLIDYDGKNKNHITNSYKGKFWKSKKLTYKEKIWVVEGIIDASSLNQIKFQAIAIISSSHSPENCYKNLDLSKVNLVIAFDNDKAGKTAISKHIAFFKTKQQEGIKIDYEIAIPPLKKDWNNLLQTGLLNDEHLNKTLVDAFWRGQLFQASSPQQYFQIYCQKYGNFSAIFEFQHQLFRGNIKEKGDSLQYTTFPLTDCSIDILYCIEDDSIQYNSKTNHRLKFYSPSEGSNIIEFTSEELTQPQNFKIKLTNYRFTFWGSDKDLTDLRKFLFKKNAPKIRQCHSLGYDKKSNCFVFSKFLYDPEGKRFQINDNGYFEKQKVSPFREKTIENFTEIKPAEFFELLFQAYSYRGLVSFGFWVSTLFSHIIFDKFGFFPFLSMHGDSHCGKSDLTKTSNRCFFIDWEGLSMTIANTRKGELRKLAQKTSLVTPLLEGKKDNSRFDYDSILPMYNRNSTQVRAKNTNDNETYELPFDGALAFIQNNEQFSSKSAKERVVSLQFKEQYLTNDTYFAWQSLQEYSPEQLAFLGHSILLNREFFEENIISKIQDIVAYMKQNNVRIDRIAKNHAIILAGFLLVSDLFQLEKKNKNYNQKNLKEYLVNIAKRKIETAKTEDSLVEHFFQSIFSLRSDKKNTSHLGFLVKEKELIIHLPSVLKNLDEQKFGTWNKKDLISSLNQHVLEKKQTRILDGKRKDCWFFKNNEK